MIFVSVSDLLRNWQIVSSSVEHLHREVVDMVEIPSKKTPVAFLRRVDGVFDFWFEPGSI